MKKTLFTMMAVALMGGQAFGVAEYKTSEMAGQMVGESGMGGMYYTVSEEALITVDSSDPTGVSGRQQRFQGGVVVFFADAVSWNTQTDLTSTNPTVNITSSAQVAQSWLDALVAGEQITLFTNVDPGKGFSINAGNLRFDGLTEGQVNLAGKDLTFKGFVYNPDTLSLGDDEIAIVRMLENNKTKGYALAGGNITSATTPEPATATLSLLALAGLASRRRRH